MLGKYITTAYMHNDQPSRFDDLMNRIKNHSVLSVIVLIGAGIVALGSVTDALTRVKAVLWSAPTELQLTDVIAKPAGETGYSLDFRLVNSSEQTATIDRVRLTVLSFSAVSTKARHAPSFLSVSAEYHVDLGDLRIQSKSIELPVAHVLRPSEADRFVLLLGMTDANPSMRLVWEIGTELLTSTGTIVGPDVSLKIPAPEAEGKVDVSSNEMLPGLRKPYNSMTLSEVFGQELSSEIRQGRVEFLDGAGEIRVIVSGEMFPAKSSELDAGFRPLLERLGKTIGAVSDKISDDIIIVGHTDNMPLPLGGYRDNQELSMQRAQNVAQALVNGSHALAGRLRVEGRGSSEPRSSNNTEEGRKSNRRLEISVFKR